MNWLSVIRSLSPVHRLRVGLALGLVAAGLAWAGTVLASTTGWRLQRSPNLSGFDQLYGVAALSSSNAWAVGTTGPRTLTERWDGKAWKVRPSPNVGRSDTEQLNAVAETSPTNAWAVGDYANEHKKSYLTLIEFWNGKAWTIQPSPSPDPIENVLSGVAATSSSNAWAVGETVDGGSLVERWNGKSWKIQPSPRPSSYSSELSGVAATSVTNAWAVGSYSNGFGKKTETLIEHWNGKAWKIQPSPNARSSSDFLNGVAATSATNAWAVGYHNRETLIEHWNGKLWKIQRSPNPGHPHHILLTGVAATSPANAWAVGYYINNFSHQTGTTVIEHWNGKAWNVQRSVNPSSSNPPDDQLYGLAVTSSANAWAVGYYSNRTAGRTLIERWNGRG